jgi:hypothetical protein
LHIDASHAVTGLMAVIMTGVVVIGLTYPPKKKIFATLGGASITLAALWVLGIAMVYITGAG